MPKLSSRHDSETLLRASVELGVVLLENPEKTTVDWLDCIVGADGKETTRYLVTVEGGSHEAH